MMGSVKRAWIESMEPKEEPPMGVRGWIPLTEQLPPLDEDVLLMCGDEQAIGSQDEDGDWWGLGLGVLDKPPTHWMPLPEMPEVKP